MKNKLTSKLLAGLIALLMVVSMLPISAFAETEAIETNVSIEKVDAPLDVDLVEADDTAEEEVHSPNEVVRVLIVLSQEGALDKYGLDDVTSTKAVNYRSKLLNNQKSIAKTISKKVLDGEELDVVWNLTLAGNAISANVKYGDIEAIKAISGVESVELENRYEAQQDDVNMGTSGAMIGSVAVWAAGYTGAGSKVAIVDTGIDTDHELFQEEAYLYSLSKNAEALGMSVDEYKASLNLLTNAKVAKVWDQLNASKKSAVTLEGTYLSEKVPYAVNYVDSNLVVDHDHDSQGEHGSHVTGIAAANRYVKTEDGMELSLEAVLTQGVAPDAQILTMKVFGARGGAFDADYMAAIEDAIVLGADSINLSLGSGNAGVSTSTANVMLKKCIESGSVVVMSAGNSGSWADNTYYGYLYSDGVSLATGGSPGSYTNSFTVASVNNDGATGNAIKVGDNAIVYDDGSSASQALMTTIAGEQGYIFIDGTGDDWASYADVLNGKIAICARGAISFYVKANNAVEAGAIATVIYNNQAGTISMNLSGYTGTQPCVSITQADGAILKAAATEKTTEGGKTYYEGTLTVLAEPTLVEGGSEYYTMSDFSSWGTPGSLELKPEITAPGGNIYSVNGIIEGGQGYELMSGTSMAAPQVTGMVALVGQYIRENDLTTKTGLTQRQLAISLLMSTAKPLIEEDSESYYSILKQGAGLGQVDKAISAGSYILMDANATKTAADGKVKAELGDDPERTGVYNFAFTINNMTDAAQKYEPSADLFTQDVFVSDDTTFLDTWTAALEGEVTFTVDGKEIKPLSADEYDVNGDGVVDEKDADAFLQYVVSKGKAFTPAHLGGLDVNGDGKYTTRDVLLFKQMIANSTINVAANSSTKVEVEIALDNEANEFYDDNGYYVEGYVFVKEIGTDEGVEGVEHSIPVLAYYGSWTEPSMFDIGSYEDYYLSGAEDRAPYMYAALSTNALKNQGLTVKMNSLGNTSETMFGGNPLGEDEVYSPINNAFNPAVDELAKLKFVNIRNYSGGIIQYVGVDLETFETSMIYSGYCNAGTAAYYYTNDGSWQGTSKSYSLDTAPLKSVKEGTLVIIALTVGTEYDGATYADIDYDNLGDGATFVAGMFVIDKTAPTLSSVVLDRETGILTVVADDNINLAGVKVSTSTGTAIETIVTDDAEPVDGGYKFTVDLSNSTATKLLVQAVDYACNTASYKINLNTEELSGEVSISLDKTETTLVGHGTGKLTASVEPWGIEDDVVLWSSSDENVVTVENGVLTPVAAGTATVTATAHADTTKTATCTVTVKAVTYTIEGVLQDENGKPLSFTWNIETEDSWSKVADLDVSLNTATGLTTGGVLINDGDDGNLVVVDPATGANIGGSYALEVTALAICEAYGGTAADPFYYNAYSTYFLGPIAASDVGSWGSGWNLRKTVVGLDYLGATLTQDEEGNVTSVVDNVIMLTTDGYIYTAKITNGSSMSRGNARTDFRPQNAGYTNLCVANDGTIFFTEFDGTTNQIYMFQYNSTSQKYDAYNIGNVGNDVWPASITKVTSNTPVDGNAIDNIIVENVEDLGAATQVVGTIANGGTNSVSKGVSTLADTDTEPFTIETEVASDDSTVTITVKAAQDMENGLVTISYNAEGAELTDSSTIDDGVIFEDDGTVSVGFAALDGVKAGDVIATLTFALTDGCNSNPNFVYTIEEVDEEEPGTQDEIEPEYNHGETELVDYVEPTEEEDGYSGDKVCTKCGLVVEEGHVLTFVNTGDNYNVIILGAVVALACVAAYVLIRRRNALNK